MPISYAFLLNALRREQPVSRAVLNRDPLKVEKLGVEHGPIDGRLYLAALAGGSASDSVLVVSQARLLDVHREMIARHGMPCWTCSDAPATPEQTARMARLSPQAVVAKGLAGEPVVARMTRVPSPGAPVGGLKMVAANGWFTALPAGVETVRIYAESFKGQAHLDAVIAEARRIVGDALARRWYPPAVYPASFAKMAGEVRDESPTSQAKAPRSGLYARTLTRQLCA
jgi:hypothetical protein